MAAFKDSITQLQKYDMRKGTGYYQRTNLSIDNLSFLYKTPKRYKFDASFILVRKPDESFGKNMYIQKILTVMRPRIRWHIVLEYSFTYYYVIAQKITHKKIFNLYSILFALIFTKICRVSKCPEILNISLWFVTINIFLMMLTSGYQKRKLCIIFCLSLMKDSFLKLQSTVKFFL